MSLGSIDFSKDICQLQDSLKSDLEPTKVKLESEANATGEGRGKKISKPTEDPSEKVERYEDGVDEMADQIEDLDAFDDLCEACDDEEDTSGPLARVRGSGPFKKLSEMWTGALEGGNESAGMKAAFDNMFDGRGFWASTEKAFTMVANEAKAAAKLNAEAAAAKAAAASANGDAADAESKGEETEKNAENPDGGAPGGGGPGGDKGGETPQSKAVDPGLASLDKPDAPPIAEYEQAEKYHGLGQDPGSAFAQVSKENGYYNQFNEQLQKEVGGSKLDRSKAIWGAVGEGFFGGFTKGFIEQGSDTLILDTLGTVLDKGLQAASKGGLKTPLIGPAISLFQSGLITDIASGNILDGKFATGLKDSGGKIFDGGASAVENLQKAMSAENGGDMAGFIFAALADYFGMLAELIGTIANILGVLSAICFILGGILVLVGLALVWLAGIGAPLITAGGWLIKGGKILGDIVTILGPVGIALTGMALFFRVLAAYLVPVDEFAEQLGNVNKDAGTFGEKSGAKIGDVTAENMKKGVANYTVKKPGEGDTAASQKAKEGDTEGGEGATATGQKVDKNSSDADALNAEGKKIHDEHEANAKKKGGDGEDGGEGGKKKKGGEEDEGGKKKADDLTTGQKAKIVALDLVKAPFRLGKSVIKDTAGAFTKWGENFANIKKDLKEWTDFKEGGARKVAHEEAAEATKAFLDEAHAKQKKLDTDVSNANATIKKISDEAAAQKQKMSELQTELASVKKKMQDVEDVPSELTSQARDLQNQITALKGSAQKTQKQASDAEAALMKAETAKGKLDKRIQNLKEGLERVRQGNVNKQLRKKQEEEQEAANKHDEAHKKAKDEHDELVENKQKLEQDIAAAKKHYEEVAEQPLNMRDRAAGMEEAAAAKRTADQHDAEYAKAKAAADYVDVEKTFGDSAYAKGQAQKQLTPVNQQIADTTQAIVGQTVTVHHDGKPTASQVKSVDADGVTVTVGGQPKKLSWDEVQGPVQAKGRELQQAHQKKTSIEQDIAKHQAVIDTTFPDLQAAKAKMGDKYQGVDSKDLKGKAIEDMQSESAAARDAGRAYIEKIKALQAQDMLSSGGDAGKLEQQAKTLREQADLMESEGPIKLAKDNISDLEGQLKTTDENIQTKAKEMEAAAAERDAAQGRSDEAGAGADKDRSEHYDTDRYNATDDGASPGFARDVLTTGSSGNATGGVGSAYKDFLDAIISGDLATMWNEAFMSDKERKSKRQEDAEANAEAQRQKLAAGNGDGEAPAEDKKEPSLGEKLGKVWSERGTGPAKFVTDGLFGPTWSSLFKEKPPVDVGAMEDRFHKAHKLTAEYAENYAMAYLWAQAESKTEALVKEGESLQHDEGDKVKANSEATAPKIDKGIADEEERSNKVNGKDTPTKKKDAQQGGIIFGLVSKLASYSKYLDEKPPGGAIDGAGSKSGEGQDKADEGAKKGKETGGDSSSKQKQTLTKMSDVQKQLDAKIASVQKELDGKIQQDTATKEEMAQKKQEHLVEATAKKDEAKSESSAFNADVQKMLTWATGFQERRKAFEQSSSGG